MSCRILYKCDLCASESYDSDFYTPVTITAGKATQRKIDHVFHLCLDCWRDPNHRIDRIVVDFVAKELKNRGF